ncbi:MAG: hypothetical protein M1819_003044 [Sarea resinae]|nr:MAG: hypothetical protein M1819_003044 [Sarea resinae]
MATEAHCLFCFETLVASLEKTDALSLSKVEDLWASYQKAQQEPVEPSDGQEDDEEEDDDEMDDTPLGATLQTPSIARLTATGASPSSGSSSSTLSTTSSARTGEADTSSKSSSNSSFFSFARWSQQHSSRQPSTPDSPLFVTWNTIGRSGTKTLRGCIGTFEAQKIEAGLESYALTSAFDDVRFSPITKKELPTLSCSVTLLTTFEPCAHALDWSLGTHGLRISFTYHGRRHGATYLPDVAPEQGWTKDETVISLMRKAGWSGRRDEWQKVADLKAVRYQGRRVGVDYADWKAWRAWVDSQK